jgi:hypothetical protein
VRPHILSLEKRFAALWADMPRSIAAPMLRRSVMLEVRASAVDLVTEVALQCLSWQPGLRRFIS